jgi:hypothetical protein
MIFATFIFLFLLAAALVVYLRLFGARRSVWALAFTAFVFRVGYVLIDRVVGIYAGGGDQSAYDATFWFVAEQWRSGVLLAPLQYGMSPGNDGYYMLIYSAVFSPAYAIFGHITTLPRIQMALVGTLTVVNIYLITEHISSHRAGLIAGLIAAVFPYWVVLSGIIYRDMFIIFLFTLMAYYLVRWQAGERDRSIPVVATVAALIGLSLRLINIIAIGSMAVATVYLMVDRKSIRYAGAAMSGLAATGLVYLNFGGYFEVDRLADRRMWLARESPGAYLSGVVYESYLELLAFAPTGAFYFFLTPFPWHVIDLMAVIAIAQNLFLWYPVLILSVIGFRDVLHVRNGIEATLPLVVFSLAGIFGYGLVEGNIGPAIRHRSQFQFAFFVLAGVTLAERIRVVWPSMFHRLWSALPAK